MPRFTITRALPNPSGKDRTPSHQVTNQQLNGEWVQFANTAGQVVNLLGLSLHHYTFDRACSKTGEDIVTPFTGTLDSGQSIRVHTGTGNRQWEGSVFHFYLGKGNFIWNNLCGDTVVLRAGADLADFPDYTELGDEGPFSGERHVKCNDSHNRPSVGRRMEGRTRGNTTPPGSMERGRVSRSDGPPQPAGRVHRWVPGNPPHPYRQAPGDSGVPVPSFPWLRRPSRWEGPLFAVAATNPAGQVP